MADLIYGFRRPDTLVVATVGLDVLLDCVAGLLLHCLTLLVLLVLAHGVAHGPALVVRLTDAFALNLKRKRSRGLGCPQLLI